MSLTPALLANDRTGVEMLKSGKHSSLWMVYNGKICMRKCLRYRITILPSLLALATLGGATQIGLFLFLVASPKVAKASAVHVAVAGDNNIVIT